MNGWNIVQFENGKYGAWKTKAYGSPEFVNGDFNALGELRTYHAPVNVRKKCMFSAIGLSHLMKKQFEYEERLKTENSETLPEFINISWQQLLDAAEQERANRKRPKKWYEKLLGTSE